MSELPTIEGWLIERPHRVPGGGGCNADSLPHYRIFAMHNESRSVVTILGGTEDECVRNIEPDILEFEKQNGIGLKLPEGWKLEFAEMSAGGKICMMKAVRGEDIVSALGINRLDAKLRIIEEICNKRTFANRLSQAAFLLQTYNNGG